MGEEVIYYYYLLPLSFCGKEEWEEGNFTAAQGRAMQVAQLFPPYRSDDANSSGILRIA